MDLFSLSASLVTGLVIIFELRSLLQNSNADFYHPFTQAVVKITNPLVTLPAVRNIKFGRYNVAGFVVAAVIAFAFWVPVSFMMVGLSPLYGIIMSVFALIKGFGYMIIFLMLAQALTSWLPSTQHWSMMFAQLTWPFISPIRRIIPPIGMIDISLMIFLFLLWALNGVFTKVLFSIDHIIGSLWLFL